MLGARSRMTSLVMFLVCSAGFLRVATANDTYNYTFIMSVASESEGPDGNGIGPVIDDFKLDGVRPTEDQFTIYKMPDRDLCAEGTCVAGQIGLIDDDPATNSNWFATDGIGLAFFSISSPTRVSTIEIRYQKPFYTPGWIIEENGVELYRDVANRGGEHTRPVVYTYNLRLRMINWVDISSKVSTSVKFVDAVVANNGKVIFAPTEEDAVGVFDPCSNTFEAVDISSHQLTDLARKFYSAALAKDGRVVFAPAHANGVGVFDPRDNSFELVNISSKITIQWKFRGAATANDGKVIFAPMNADGVGVFDPSDHSFELVDIGLHNDWLFNGATLAKNGLIIFSPLAAGTGLGVFNPMDNSFELVPISSHDGMTGSMGAFVTLSNGEMLSPPRTATAVGVFNPVTKAFRTVPITVAADDDDKFHAAALTNDGKVVFAPGGALGVGIFDPTDDSFEYFDYSAQINAAGVAKFWGAALVRNGAVVFTPTTSNRVGIFYPSGTPPAPCCLTSTLDVKNGGVGDCPATLLDGETCQPECDDPYEASGATTCLDGVLKATTCLDVSCDMEKCCYDFNVRNGMTTPVGCAILYDDFVPAL